LFPIVSYVSLNKETKNRGCVVVKGLLGKAKIPITIFSVILLAIFVINFVLPSIAASGSALVWTTDTQGNIKNDFEPGEIVYMHGTGFNPESQIDITITRPDQTPETCNALSCNSRFLDGLQTSDPEGDFVYRYNLNGIVGEYTVDVTDGENTAPQITFTDSRNIDSAKLNDANSVTVPPSTSITAKVTVTTSGSGSNNNWESTRYLIEGGSWQCVDTPDHTDSGTYTESFNIIAPSSPGVYDVSFRAYRDDSCSQDVSNTYILTNGITVQSPVCGNGAKESGEACDDGNTANCDGCKGDCSRYDNVCGDGIIECGEGCDDHNTNSNDGCSSTCQVENGWSCSGEPSECTVDNPTLSSSCGIDIALIIDNSGSIDNTELTAMKNAFKAFVDAFLPNTPTQMALVKFNTNGDLVLDYSGDATTIKNAIDSVTTSSGYTNWQDGLKEAYDEFDNRADKPDLYVFASDGNPNRYGDPAQTATEPVAVAQAVLEANQIKLSGIRIITLGIGLGTGGAANLQAISSADAYYSSGFDTLAQTLAAIAEELCGGTITVKKLVDGQPASGWTFSTSVTGGTSTPTSSTTGGDGFINPIFDINIDDTTATVDVTETPKGGYFFVSANCIDQNQNPVGTPGQGTVTGITIEKNDAIYCEFQNTEYECEVDEDCTPTQELCYETHCMKGECVDTFVDNDGPDTSNIVVDPYYNNGIFNLTATTQDQCSVIKTAEYFVGFVNGGVGSCDPDAPVKGTIYPADDGSFDLDKLLENLLKKNIVFRSDGVNWACVKAQDNANNWGNCECVNFETDVLPPDCPYDIYLDNVLYPDEYLICGNNAWLNATVCDQESKMQGGEYFLDITIPPVPVPWSGFWMNTLYNFTRQDSWKCSIIGALVDTSNLEDGTHYIKLRGKDTAENWGKISECLGVSFVRDTTAPSTTKDVDETKIRCGITSDDEKGNSIEQCWYIQQGTHIHLTASDPDPQQTGEFSGLDKIMCQFRWKLNWEDDWSAWSAPAECPNPIVFNEDSYHEIKYWAVDNCGNAEAPHYEIDIVDTQAPLVTKSVGTPQHVCGEGENCDYYITGQTPITLDCVDQGPHPVDNVKIYYRYYLDGQTELPLFTEDSDHVVFTIPQDSRHIVEYYCVDALGNSDGTMQTPYHEVDIVDNKPPIVSKDVGTPKVESTGMTQYQVPDKFDVKDTAWFITQNTEITLSCQDDEPHPSDHVKIYYKYYVDGEIHQDWTEYTGTPIKYNEDTYHELYYYCQDTLGNRGETHYELDIVDTQAPHTTKTVGNPKYAGTGGVDWWVTQQTPITLSCVDQGSHPVDDVTLYYRIYNDSILIQDWTLYTGTFHFTEDSEHRLEWYCADALGNSEGSAENPIVEIDQVDTAPPEIVKWVDDSTVQQGDTVKICANVTDKKLTGDPGVGVAWVKAKLILGEDPIYVDLVNVEGDTYCGDWVVPQIKQCYRCHESHCEYKCVWELWVKSEDLLGNFNKTDGIQIIVDNAPPKIQAVLWPSKDKYYRDGKTFEVKALAIDFGGDSNILNSDNCKASGVKECRFYAIKYDFESVDQSEIKNLWDYLSWLEETTGTPIEKVYLGSVPWVNGYCKGSLQFPEDSGLQNEDILFLAYEIEDNSGNMKSGLAEDWDGDKVTMKMDQVGPSVVITEGGNLPGPFTTGNLVQVFASLQDIDSGPKDCWADLYKCVGENSCEESVDTGFNLDGQVYDFKCEISDALPPGLDSGDYQIVITTTDNELNTGKSGWDYLTVDNTPPVTELIQPATDDNYDEEIPIEINITDASGIEDSTVQYRIFEPPAWYSPLMCLMGYCPYDSGWQTATWDSETETYKDAFDASELEEGKTYFLSIRGCDVLYDATLFTVNTVDLHHCVMR
jgi:cysteine-rich repeat protein